MKVGIEGHNSLVRDTNNMAIINTDSSALEAARRRQREAQDKARRKGRATDIAPAAVVANGVPIPEDHRFE